MDETVEHLQESDRVEAVPKASFHPYADSHTLSATYERTGSLSGSIAFPRLNIAVVSLVHLTPSDVKTWCEAGPAKNSTVRALSSRHRRIASMAARGFSNKRIAAHLSISPQTICNLRRNPAFKLQVESLEKDIHEGDGEYFEFMVDVRDLALDKLHGLLVDNAVQDPKELRSIAVSLGDRTGHAPVAISRHENLNGITPQTLDFLKEAAHNADPIRRVFPDRNRVAIDPIDAVASIPPRGPSSLIPYEALPNGSKLSSPTLHLSTVTLEEEEGGEFRDAYGRRVGGVSALSENKIQFPHPKSAQGSGFPEPDFEEAWDE